MLNITCVVGRLRRGIELPFPTTLNGETISDYFLKGSMNSQGEPIINLALDQTSRGDAGLLPNNEPTNIVNLQRSLRRITQNPSSGRINRVGLIIGDRFQPRTSLLGLMFDFGFDTVELGNVHPDDHRLAREGCAIFLDAVHDIRGNQGDFRSEIVFTAIHELGHVFNLWHLDSPSNFMSTSRNEAPFSSNSFFFHRSHRAFLHQADLDEHVWPGGSAYENRGTIGPAANDPFMSLTKNNTLTLKINIDQKEFWYFEPIEMDVTVSSNRKVTIPDKVDPGYEEFMIFITRPDGTVFKYRSPRIYCQNPATVEIGAVDPFKRDISIFGQSRGYTFNSPGIYKIRCLFKIYPDTVITSNVLEVLVKEPKLDNAKFLSLQQVLTQKGVGYLLYHRAGSYKPAIIAALEEIARKHRRFPLGANAEYALARYMTHKNFPSSTDEVKKVDRLIKRSLDSGNLSENRARNLVSIRELI